MQRPAKLFEVPEIGKGDMLFTLKDVAYTPEAPRLKQPFTVKGKIELFKIPFLAPIWVQARVTYPEAWWEEIIPIIGSPTVAEGAMAIGSDFEITFPRGFEREGEFLLDVEAYAGPTYTIDKLTLPPFPPVTTEKTTFIVAGEVPPEEVGFQKFRIISYSKNAGLPVTPLGVLELDIGDRCRVNVGLDHRNGAVTGKFYAAIWQERPWDPHDEVLHADKSFSVSPSTDWQPFTDYIDIPITSAISPGTEYGLYVKIIGITGGDIFTEYLANVITIVGVPPEEADIADWDFVPTKGTYDIGEKVPFTAKYKYKGIAQKGQLTISIGTGIVPTFTPVVVCEPMPVEFEEAADWKPGSLEGSFPLTEDLELGQTYSVRARLETLTARTQETDTDWSAFDITKGPPASDIADWDFKATRGTYDLGAKVPYDANYKYKGKAQSGYLTISLGTGVAPSFFTKHTFPPVSVSFDEAMDWTPGLLSGSFTLPTLEPGQTYNVRTKLETADGAQETDTDWGVFDITLPPPPPPMADIADFDFRAEGGTYNIGDRVPYDAAYKYKGKAQGGYLTISLGTGVAPSFFTRHTFPRVSVSFDEAMDWTPDSLSGSFTLPTTLEPGQTYNVRAKLETADGAQETDTDWRVITIEEVVPPPPPPPPTADIADFDFRAEGGTYAIGDRVPYDAGYKYKGKAQGGYLTISLGTGTYPSFFTRHTFPRVSVSFDEAMDWTPDSLSGNFTLPTTLEPGQTYNVRAKLETADGVQETDTDWRVITIEEVAPPPPPPPPPPPKADIADWDFRAEGGTYDIGDRVPFTADYKYKGKSQSGQLVLELGTGVYPTFYPKVRYAPMPVGFAEAMDWESRSLEGTFLLTEALEPGQTYSVRAKLETLIDRTQETDTDWGVIAIEVLPPPEEYTLTVQIRPLGAGWVTKEPDKTRYSYGEIVRLTAHNAPGYSFQSWWIGDEFLGSSNPINYMVLADRAVTAYYL